MKGRLIRSIFWISVAVFVIAVGTMLIPPLGQLSMRFIGIPAWVILAGLGITLIVLTIKQKVAGITKAFLLLNGASMVGIPFFAVLHNVIYGLFIIWFGADFWERTGLGDEPVMFIMATLVCPLGFLVGAAGTIVITIKNRRSEENI